MITTEQKTTIQRLTNAVVVAEVTKRATPRHAVERPRVQAAWHKAVDELDLYLDGLVRK